MRYRVIRSHTPEKSPPLTLRQGQHLRFERRATEWRGWLWCTTESGETGWVPEAWARIEGDTCIALRDYCSAELTVQTGQEVVADLVESGWARVCDDQGQAGWVPLECLEEIYDS